jgi:CelD/BcsL family acetyltransferase involved in cellulose biosynthesis
VSLEVSIIDRESDLSEIQEMWDGLAIATGRPFCSPAWMLAWWRHMRPRRSGLRVVVVREGAELLGVVPLWAARADRRFSRYEVLSAGICSPVGPLARSGREDEVVAVMASNLQRARPFPLAIRLSDQAEEGSLPEKLIACWPGRGAWSHATPSIPVPVVSLGGLDFDQWLAGRRAKFRQEAARRRRHLEQAGARFSLADTGGFDLALKAFFRLHERRQGPSKSKILQPGIEAMLKDAGATLVEKGRLRVFTIDCGGKAVAASVLLAAGDRVSGWSAGFDIDWGKYAPSVQLMLYAIADAIDRGEATMSLGPGASDYKLRVADRAESVATVTLVPRGRRYLLARMGSGPYQLRWALSKRMPPRAKRALKSLAGG